MIVCILSLIHVYALYHRHVSSNVFNLQCPKPERVVTFNYVIFIKIITGIDDNVMSCLVFMFVNVSMFHSVCVSYAERE